MLPRELLDLRPGRAPVGHALDPGREPERVEPASHRAARAEDVRGGAAAIQHEWRIPVPALGGVPAGPLGAWPGHLRASLSPARSAPAKAPSAMRSGRRPR